MKKLLKIGMIVLAVVFFGLQFVRPDFSNPAVTESETLFAILTPPDNIREVITRSCADCHSNETKYPWYSQIQPSAWFLKDHIDEGRRELNFSVWKSYEPRRQRKKLVEICEQVNAGEMPLPSYLWIHRDAVMTADQSRLLCEWAESEAAKLADK